MSDLSEPTGNTPISESVAGGAIVSPPAATPATAEATAADATAAGVAIGCIVQPIAATTATADMAEPIPPDNPIATEDLDSERERRYRQLAAWRAKDAALEKTHKQNKTYGDKVRLLEHRSPGPVPVLKWLLYIAGRRLRDVAPVVQARMEAERLARPRPRDVYNAEVEKLKPIMLELMAAQGWAADILDRKNFYGHNELWEMMLKTNAKLEKIKEAANRWEDGGERSAISEEQWVAEQIRQEIKDLTRQLAEAEAIALG